MNAHISVVVGNIDHYMSRVSIGSDLNSVTRVPWQECRPVIRVFGSTSLGQRVCVHLHGVLPYMYFRPENLRHGSFDDYEKINRILPTLKSFLEDALHARRTSIAQRDNHGRVKRRKHIHQLQIVKKKTIYGMVTDELYFVKVLLLEPGDAMRLASVLQDSALAGIRMQPYEAHIPYLLQFTSDYNVSPMGWMHLKTAKFRLPLPPLEAVEVNPVSEALAASSSALSPAMLTPPAPSAQSPVLQFLSSTAPSPARVHTLQHLQSEQPHLSLFTQASVPMESTWAHLSAPPHPVQASSSSPLPDSTSGYAGPGAADLSDEHSKEVREILDSLTEADLVWSQFDSVESAPPLSAAPSAAAPPPPVLTQPPSSISMEKISSCELEVDSHVDLVLNVVMQTVGFGAELWQEERLRLAREGKQLPEPVTPPSTPFMRRLLQPKELEYYERFRSLQEKGRALRKMSRGHSRRPEEEKEEKKESEEDLAAVPAPSPADVFAPSPPSSSRSGEAVAGCERGAEGWASQVLTDSEVELRLQRELALQILSDPVHASEALVRSQSNLSAAPPETSTRSRDGDDPESDEEHSQECIRRENDAILTSTQLDIERLAPEDEEEKKKKKKEKARPSTAGLPEVGESLPDPLPGPLLEPLLSGSPSPWTDSQVEAGVEAATGAAGWPSGVSLRKRGAEAFKLATAFDTKRPRTASGGSPSPRASPFTPGWAADPAPSTPATPAAGFLSLSLGAGDRQSGSRTHKSVSFAAPLPSPSPPLSQPPPRPGMSVGTDSRHAARLRSERRTRFLVHSAKLFPAHLPPRPAGRHCHLRPSFSPPLARSLLPLHTLHLPEVLHVSAHFSVREDAVAEARELAAAQHSGSYAGYQAHTRSVPYQRDCPLFDGGQALLEGDTPPCAPLAVPRCVPRRRGLLPSFSPPRLSLAEQQASLPAAKACLPKAPPCAPTQLATPTQTAGPVPSPSQPGLVQRVQLDASPEAFFFSGQRSTRLMVVSMELFCCSRQDLLPNPKHDAIQAIVWVADDMVRNETTDYLHRFGGVLAVLPAAPPREEKEEEEKEEGRSAFEEREQTRRRLLRQLRTAHIPTDTQLELVEHEADLFQHFLDRIRGLDPDFLVGYENSAQSFGYFIKRGAVLGLRCVQLLSRVPGERPSFRVASDLAAGHLGEEGERDGERDGERNGEREGRVDPGDLGLVVKGRTFLNAWQLLAAEVKLADCSVQKVVELVLHKTLPAFSARQLTRWYQHGHAHSVLSYVYALATANLLLLDKLDFFRKTAVCARLYGIDFDSVLRRGSQYRVEAALLGRAHKEGYLLVSPSRDQVASQAAMEVIPLVLEPRSQFYTDPVLVLDFQSLYPSIMMAFNLCFSTLAGKLRPGPPTAQGGSDTTGRLGVLPYPEATSAVHCSRHGHVSVGLGVDGTGQAADGAGQWHTLDYSAQQPYVSPNGCVFAAKTIRRGVLPAMVEEMLQTRSMVKTAMAVHAGAGNEVLRKILDARQLAIKLLANVTYGYTAAGFSGRMPMAELADAIVQTGRSLLEHTFQVINSHPTWKARVVYGDTDSVFVHLPHRSLAQAFALGEEIAAYITRTTPAPLVLKFEKVYFPCLLVSKKRYVGQSFENKHDLSASRLDAKGIEMVRKDQCAAVHKVQARALRLLFQTRDLSRVKAFLLDTWRKLLGDGAARHARDLIFYKEVRYGHYHSAASQPPGAVVASKAVCADEMAVPPYNWRVPYLVATGPPNTPLKYLVYAPAELLRRGSALRCHALYYVLRCINPALDRVLSLAGVSVAQWFRAMTRPKARIRHVRYTLYAEAGVEGSGRPETDDTPPPPPSLRLFPPRRARGVVAGERRGSSGTQVLMDQFTTHSLCEVCGVQDALPRRVLCGVCVSPTQRRESVVHVLHSLRGAQERNHALVERCRRCAQYCPNPHTELFAKHELLGRDACESLACDVFHERLALAMRLEDLSLAVRDVEDLPG